MDTKLRKIANPTPEIAIEAISLFPKVGIHYVVK
jgi:acyl-CoA thioester hydrolase